MHLLVSVHKEDIFPTYLCLTDAIGLICLEIFKISKVTKGVYSVLLNTLDPNPRNSL